MPPLQPLTPSSQGLPCLGVMDASCGRAGQAEAPRWDPAPWTRDLGASWAGCCRSTEVSKRGHGGSVPHDSTVVPTSPEGW